MHFVRRAALRAASSPSTLITKSRSINTSSPFVLRSKVQDGLSTSVFKRFASDEAESRKEESINSASDGESGYVKSAIDSASESAESATTYASEAAESLTKNYEQAKDTVVDTATSAAAAVGYAPRRDNYSQRDNYSRDNRGGQERQPYASRPNPADRILTPTPGIYIGNLLFDITANDLIKEFESFGTIKSAIIASDARGLSKGFGYVEFETTEQATAAIEARHQSVLEGRRLIVNYMAKTMRENKQSPPSKTLFIGNLAFEMSDADLNKLFRDIRNVIDVRVAIDRRTGQPRGFAHADFVDVESAQAAQAILAGKEIYGRKLRVDYSAGSRDSRPRAEGSI